MSPALAQSDDLLARVERTREVMAASPVLQLGETPVDVASDDGQFFWIEAPGPGLYRIALDEPGAIKLMFFANADGRYDGETRESVVANRANGYVAPEMGPFLLTGRWPYLLSVNTLGPAKLRFEQVEAFDTLSPLPEKDSAIGTGIHLLELSGELRLSLPDPESPLRIETWTEPRTKHASEVGRIPIEQGLFPYDPDKDVRLSLKTEVQDGQPAALTLLRILPSGDELDETEPNRDDPDTFDLAKGYRGVMLRGSDFDTLTFTLDAPREMSFKVTTEAIWADFQVMLERVEDRDRFTALLRSSERGVAETGPLSLPAGDYRLQIQSENQSEQHIPYDVAAADGAPAKPGHEIEPNDHARAAVALPPEGTLRGRVAADDIDFIAFSVDTPDRLWRVFSLGADRLILHGHGGTIADVSAINRRAIADALALVPGDYLAEVRGTGDYAFRVMELGERPEGYEAEPNGGAATAQFLTFGQTVTGNFPWSDDTDGYQFRLNAETPVEIVIEPSGDGPMDAKLHLGNTQWAYDRDFEPGQGTYVFRGKLPAGDWFIFLRALSNNTRGSYRLTVSHLPDVADDELDFTPLTARPVPMDGDVSGSVGAFDAVDNLLVRLPEGEGTALVTCTGGGRNPGWSLWPWSGGKKLDTPKGGMIFADYPGDLGGAARIFVEGSNAPQDYACSVRFPADTANLPAPTPAGTDEVVTIAPGQSLEGTLTAELQRQTLKFDMAPGDIGLMACFDADGQGFEPRSDNWRAYDMDVVPHERFAPMVPIYAGNEPRLELRAPNRGEPPFDWRCTLLGLDDLPRLASQGPLAELTVPPEAAPTRPENTPEQAGEPPSLDALLALVPPESQPSGDLPVAITLDEVPPLAAYSSYGQRLALGAELRNEGDTALDLELEPTVTGEGWTASVDPTATRLEPGATAQVSVSLTAPPLLSPMVQPSLTLTATAGAYYATQVASVPLSPDAPARDGFVHWDAPEALRGGLNLLHYGLGARLVRMDGKELNERDQGDRAYVHDGVAPHANAREVHRDLVFKLPASAQITGAMLQLRSSVNPTGWPGEYEIFTSSDGIAWTKAAEGTLRPVMGPQYTVFDAPIEAAYFRILFPDCPARGCNRISIQEIQAIGVPGEHPQGWPSINAAARPLGGHVVYAQPNHSGDWNAALLHADPERSNGDWRIREETLSAVIGFHQNRAALLERIAWVGNPRDELRAEGTTVEASLAGPDGPWTPLGILPSPPIGEDRAELVLDQPTWARYLRVTIPLPHDTRPVGPDAIEAIEAPGTSVIGLWEDDRAQAAYEYQTEIKALAPVEPAGGPDRDNAVRLATDTVVDSSVLLERNEDWWVVTVPDGPPQEAVFDFRSVPLEIAVEVMDIESGSVDLKQEEYDEGTRLSGLLFPGDYMIRVYEPPRSVVISWDTSGSVGAYIPRTLAAVRLWAESLQPGRDALQLLPFSDRPDRLLLPEWAERPEDVAPALRDLPATGSSAAEETLSFAAKSLIEREGARGVVIITDAETGPDGNLWPYLLASKPRVVSLSIDSDGRQNAAIMMDWANLNGGRFQRVVGVAGLADGLDMAAALFRAPKAYRVEATFTPFVEPEGEAVLSIMAPPREEGAPAPAPTGAIEVILDASGSMLKRLDGKRRIAIAHDALSRLVTQTLPEGTPFAFRAFGLEKDACRTELRIPVSPLQRKAAEATIRDVPAINLAKTAIAASLLAAAEDLKDASPPRVVVLVTDGEETCDGDPEAAIAALRAQGLDVRVNIVGFAIDDAELAQTFAAWAEAGGGAYFDASNAEGLTTAIDKAMTPRFEVHRTHIDGRVERIGSLALGEKLTVPAGQISVTPGAAAQGETVTLRVAPEENVRLTYGGESGLGSE
ncbi:MAG: VWA domain-containing protein [Rhodobacteraceae bacterium]|nr:VWA domain-containing protein [Paracoccaceae bacterium]